MPPHSVHLTTSTPLSKSHFPTNLPSSSLSKTTTNLHFPSLSSPNPTTSLSLPPKPPTKFPELPPPFPPNSSSDFQEKMLFLDSLGIDLFSLISAHPPAAFTASSDLKSAVSLLRHSASLSPSDLRRIAAMCPDVLSLPPSSLLPVLTFLLREASVPASSLRHVIHRRPRLLASDVKSRLRPTLYFLQGQIGIADVSKHAYLLSCSVEDKFIPRLEYFYRIGVSNRDAKSMFRRFPALFCYSIAENFEPKFNYFLTEMGRDLKELVDFPQYFSFSLENRIKPRHRKCVEKGVFLSLPLMLKSIDRRFLDRLEVCCDSSMPVRASPLWNISYNHDNVL